MRFLLQSTMDRRGSSWGGEPGSLQLNPDEGSSSDSDEHALPPAQAPLAAEEGPSSQPEQTGRDERPDVGPPISVAWHA